jgi:hypothetical protein
MAKDSDLKTWLVDIAGIFDTMDTDRTPDIIKANRTLMSEYHTGIDQLKGITAVGDTAIELFDSWYHYFDTGKKTAISIDDLPETLKQALAVAIEGVMYA